MMNKLLLRLALVSSVLIFLLSCSSGGGTVVGPIQILRITPEGIAGKPGEQVTFSAETSAPAVEYRWDFGGGAEPNYSFDATPTVTLLDPGTYSFSLTVIDGNGTIAQYLQEYELFAVGTNWTEVTLPKDEMASPLVNSLAVHVADQGVQLKYYVPPKSHWYQTTGFSPSEATDFIEVTPPPIGTTSSISVDRRILVVGQVQGGPGELRVAYYLSSPGGALDPGDWTLVVPNWSEFDPFDGDCVGERVIKLAKLGDNLGAILCSSSSGNQVFTYAPFPDLLNPNAWSTPVEVPSASRLVQGFGENDGRLAWTTWRSTPDGWFMLYREAPSLLPPDSTLGSWGATSGHNVGPLTITGDAQDLRRNQLLVINDRLWADAGRGNWYRATVPHPTQTSDWVPMGLEGGQPVFDGERVVVARSTKFGLYVQRALTDAPMGPNDFTEPLWIDRYEAPKNPYEIPLQPVAPRVAAHEGRIYILYPAEIEERSTLPGQFDFATLKFVYSDGTWTE